jgi:uncharacterized protein (UPF0261 family)
MTGRTVAILGTLDTKGAEYAFLKARIEAEGLSTLVIDAGVLGPPAFAPDVAAAEVARAAGADLAALVAEGDRGRAVAAMSRGAAAIVKRLHEEGRIHGLVAMGGGGGTTIGATAMQALPVGFPKLLLSTVASGDTSSYVGVKDIAMMPSVVDIAGLNRLSSRILANAAGAIAGMAKVEVAQGADHRPLIAATMFGVTTPCVTRAREVLEEAGYEVLVFHAVGSGGRAMEELIRGGFVAGVLDITTTELADEIAGGVLSAGPGRLDAAAEAGVPQVVSLGALDMVNFGPIDTVPAKYKDRKLHKHNQLVTLMRTTPAENAELGRLIARKLNRASGPTTLLIPTGGVSLIDVPGQPFHDPEADAALFDALRSDLGPNVRLVEEQTHINDPAFAVRAAETLLESLAGRGAAAAGGGRAA